jgi:DNA anti-recombination protein RmuC
LLSQEGERVGDWVVDASQARADVAFAAAQGASLTSSVSQLPALANPQKDMRAIAEQYSVLQKQAQDRAAAHGRLIDDLRELLNTSQARQAAIDERLRTVGIEGQRWSAYYVARQARAQVECSLINPAAAAAQSAVPRAAPAAVPRPATPGKKQ